MGPPEEGGKPSSGLQGSQSSAPRAHVPCRLVGGGLGLDKGGQAAMRATHWLQAGEAGSGASTQS